MTTPAGSIWSGICCANKILPVNAVNSVPSSVVFASTAAAPAIPRRAAATSGIVRTGAAARAVVPILDSPDMTAVKDAAGAMVARIFVAAERATLQEAAILPDAMLRDVAASAALRPPSAPARACT